MQFFELLQQKLQSPDIDLIKKIRLTKNALSSAEITFPRKEEVILSWLLKTCIEITNPQEKDILLRGFIDCISGSYLSILPSTMIKPEVKADILADLQKLLNSVEISNPLTNAVLNLFKYPIYSSYFKRTPDEFSNTILWLGKHCNEEQAKELIAITLDFFNNDFLREKFAENFFKTGLIGFTELVILHNSLEAFIVESIGKLFVRKKVLSDLQNMLNSLFKNEKSEHSNGIVLHLTSGLLDLFNSNVDIDIKVNAFCIVFKAFVQGWSENCVAILQWFVLLSHIIGVESLIVMKSLNLLKPNRPLIDNSLVGEIFKVHSPECNTVSYKIFNSLLQCLSKLNRLLYTITGTIRLSTWLESLILVLSKQEELNSDYLEVFTTCIDLEPVIVESTISDIFTTILLQSPSIFNKQFKSSYVKFLNNSLRMFYKLQRINKFIFKLLPKIKETQSSLKLSNLFPPTFMSEFSNIVTMLPTEQSLSIMDAILEQLKVDCIGNLENSKESINVLFVQVTSELLSAFLLGVRVLGSAHPRHVINVFDSHLAKLETILGKFGKFLLARTYECKIVQPFLKLSYHWGETQALVDFYTSIDKPLFAMKDVAPTDLSGLYGYLDESEWNVLAERISNFGVKKCNQLFLQLILQKLRVSKMKKDKSGTNLEATSKYLMLHLTSDIYNHNLVEELTPEDVGLIIEHLPSSQSKLLVEKLYHQLLEHSESKLSLWLCDPYFSENEKFVTLVFSATLKEIGTSLSEIERSNGSMKFPLGHEIFNGGNFLEIEKLSESARNVLNHWKDISKFIKKNKKEVDFKKSVEILKMLPLTSKALKINSVAFVSIIILAVFCSSDEELVEILLKLTVNFLEENLQVVCNVDISLCIKWLVEFDSFDMEHIRYRIIDLMIKSSPLRTESFNELNKLMDLLEEKKMKENKLLEAEVLLYYGLGKSWVRATSKKGINDTIAEYRRKIESNIKTTLQSVKYRPYEPKGTKRDVLLKAYCLELQSNEISGLNEDPSDKGCMTFLTHTLKKLPVLRKDLPDETLFKIWSAFKFCDNADYHSIYLISTDKEFKRIVPDLFKTTEKLLEDPKTPTSHFQKCMSIWSCFMTQKSGTENSTKEKLLRIQFENLFDCLQSHRPQFSKLPLETMIHLLRFLHFCISKNEIFITSFMIDTTFDLISDYRFKPEMTANDFQSLLSVYLDITSSAAVVRYEITKYKFPNLFQLFRLSLGSIASRSDASSNLNDEELTVMATCAFFLEKWSKSVTDKCHEDLTRIVDYFIAEVLNSFVTFNIYPAVKLHLTNCIFNLLHASDVHSRSHLSRLLPHAEQQIFIKLYSQYKKYHKFIGKI